MSPGELLADRLTAQFLENGNFMSAPGMKALPAMGVAPALAGREESEFGAAFAESGFAGLAVLAVGHEEGGPRERVHVYVAKGSRKAVTMTAEDEEVEIVVNRIGKLAIRPEQAITTTHRGNLYMRGKRVACGSSCAPSGENYSGTLGALVRKQSSRAIYVLSNNHVLAACNHTPVGMPILAPSNADGRAKGRAPGEIARLAEICELRSGAPDLVNPCEEDAAIAKVEDPDLVSSWQGDDTNGYDTPSSVAPLASDLRVKKVGRTTGLTTGVVESRIGRLIFIPYKTKSFSAGW
jgi:hypothetical protein